LADRHINTTNAHLYLLQKSYAPVNLKLRLGITATRPTGSIDHLVGSLDEGTLRSETFRSLAWGIGPAAEAAFELLRGSRTTLNIDLSAAGILYDRRFPEGGDHYNGMFQAGPSLSYSPSPGNTLTLSYRWMRVSNGQGEGSHNPAYEAKGVTLRYQRSL
jgi:lipid A 3-O-deacylase